MSLPAPSKSCLAPPGCFSMNALTSYTCKCQQWGVSPPVTFGERRSLHLPPDGHVRVVSLVQLAQFLPGEPPRGAAALPTHFNVSAPTWSSETTMQERHLLGAWSMPVKAAHAQVLKVIILTLTSCLIREGGVSGDGEGWRILQSWDCHRWGYSSVSILLI